MVLSPGEESPEAVAEGLLTELEKVGKRTR